MPKPRVAFDAVRANVGLVLFVVSGPLLTVVNKALLDAGFHHPVIVSSFGMLGTVTFTQALYVVRGHALALSILGRAPRQQPGRLSAGSMDWWLTDWWAMGDTVCGRRRRHTCRPGSSACGAAQLDSGYGLACLWVRPRWRPWASGTRPTCTSTCPSSRS
jgi:hypothetical protein